MEFPKGLRYSQEHEWVRVANGIATVGITDYAQEQLGDVVYIELPSIDSQVVKDEAFGVVESVKAVSDIYAPVSGRVVEVNTSLSDHPEVINEDPYGDAWMIRVEMSDPGELEDLMTAEEYEAYIAQQGQD